MTCEGMGAIQGIIFHSSADRVCKTTVKRQAQMFSYVASFACTTGS